MNRKLSAWAIGLALVTAACTGGEDRRSLGNEFTTFPPQPPTTATAPPATTVPPSATTTTAPAPAPIEAPGLPGRLVILDELGNVAVVDPDGTDLSVITDAFAEGAAYFQPLWAPDAAGLAWGEASPAGFALTTSGPDGSDRIMAPMPSPPFYVSWAPDGRHLAALHNGVNGVEMKLVEFGRTRSTFVGTGTPFYISWNPGGDDLVAHIGADRLVTIGLAGATREIGMTDAGYQAPHWIPGGIVHLFEEELLLLDSDDGIRALATLRGPSSFVANAQGSLLAAQVFAEDQPAVSVALQQAPEIRTNAVVVLDLTSGETSTASDGLSLGFFWSPDGEKLLMLNASDEPGAIDAMVWEAGDTQLVTTFTPQGSFVRDVLPFFAQYSQSYQMWAPDSTAIALAGMIDDEDGIWVQPIDGSEARRVSAGTWVAWSIG
jgi:hypothetical protein